LEHLSKAWPEMSRRIREAAHILLLSDYDGTLTPIVERPELAELPPQTREKLKALAGRHRYTVGIISGRALSDLKQKVKLNGIVYAGNHGLEIEGPGFRFVNPVAEEVKPVLRLLYQVLTGALGAIRGVLVEDKGLTLSVHYRQVDDGEEREVKQVFDRVTGPAQAMGKLRATSGKKVYEVRPAVAWHKGKAIELLVKKRRRRARNRGLLVIFMGDDLTDEDGFKVVESYKGLSLFVGDENPQSVARYFVASPAEAERFLELLLDVERGGHAE